jgi:hypothetical protein
MSGQIAPYLALVTSQHRKQANYVASLSVVLQGLADGAAATVAVPGLYDLDSAVGAQLDVVGQWVGISRALSVPLTDVYFSLDTEGVGFDEGTWLGPYDPESGLVDLPDDAYRTLLRATIAANQWDGSIPQAYEIWDTLFSGTETTILIGDNGDMSMVFALLGPAPDAVTLALLTGGYLALKPAGVRIAAYLLPSVPDSPLFGFDAETDAIAGFDTGAWPTDINPT